MILEDKIEQNIKEHREKLNKLGITTRMFTGDIEETAEEIANFTRIINF